MAGRRSRTADVAGQFELDALAGGIERGDAEVADLPRAGRLADDARILGPALLPACGEHGRKRRDVRLARGGRQFGRLLLLGKRTTGHQSFAEFHPRGALRNVHDAPGDDVAGFVLGDVLVGAGGLKLLDAEAYAAPGLVHFDHQRLDHLTQLERVLRMIDALLGGDVADVDHPLDAFGQLDKRSELGQAGDASLGDGADWEFLHRLFPRVAQRLLEAQADPLGAGVDVQNHGFDEVAGLHHILNLAGLLRPGEVEHADQTLDAGLHFDERTELHGAGHFAAHALTGLVFLFNQRPRVGGQLLQAERNLVRLAVDLQDLDFEVVAGVQHVGRLLHPMPGDLGHVQQAVDAAQVQKRAEVGEGAHRAANDSAFLERIELLASRLVLLVLKNGAAVYNDVFVGGVELDDAAGDFLAGQLFHLGRGLGAAAGGGQKRAHADIAREPALDHAGDDAGDDLLLGERALEGRPVFGPFDLDLGELVIALRIAAADRHDHLVADGDVRLARCVAKLIERQDAFGLPANVDKDGVARHGHDLAGAAAFCLARLLGSFKLVEDLAERRVRRGRLLQVEIVGGV